MTAIARPNASKKNHVKHSRGERDRLGLNLRDDGSSLSQLIVPVRGTRALSLAVLLLLFIIASPQLSINLTHNTSNAKVCRLQRSYAVVAAPTPVAPPTLSAHAGAATVPTLVAAHIAAVYRCCSIGHAFW